MPRGRPREFDEHDALQRALQVFWEHGYGATGIAELTAAMGIGRQSLYDTFGDKRALFLRALQAYCDQMHGQLTAVLAGDGTPGERLAAFLELWGEMLAGPMRHGCLLVCSIGEFSSQGDDEVLETMRREVERMHGLVEAVIRAAVLSGEIDSSVDPADLTATLVATANGLATQARLADAAEPARAAARSFRGLLGL